MLKPEIKVEYPTVIYDGDCAFCSSSIRFLQKMIPSAPTMIPYQFIQPEQYGLTLKQCQTALVYVGTTGKISQGHEAYRQMLIELGGGYKVLGHMMRTPVYYGIANSIYRWIAKNRHKMPGGTPTCSLENRP